MPLKQTIEIIPDDNELYMRVHKNHYDKGVILTGCIKNHGGGMSTDWKKYAKSPYYTRNGCHEGKNPLDYGIIKFISRDVREIPFQEIIHSPSYNNKAHTNIVGDKSDVEIRIKFVRIMERLIEPGEE